MMPRGINWGQVLGWAGVVQCVLSSIGYAFAKDARHSLYYLFAAAITTCVIWR